MAVKINEVFHSDKYLFSKSFMLFSFSQVDQLIDEVALMNKELHKLISKFQAGDVSAAELIQNFKQQHFAIRSDQFCSQTQLLLLLQYRCCSRTFFSLKHPSPSPSPSCLLLAIFHAFFMNLFSLIHQVSIEKIGIVFVSLQCCFFDFLFRSTDIAYSSHLTAL